MKRLLFVDSTPGFTPDRKDTKACGGILNSLTIIPQYLAKKGWDVTVSCSHKKKETINGVTYVPHDAKEEIPKWDITIINRNGVTAPLVSYCKSIGAKTVWWLHDIVDFRYLNDCGFKHVDKVLALSEYCKESYSDFYDIPKDKFWVIPNGVDKSVFYPGKYEDRKKGKLLMASALIKGFLPVFDTWANVKRQFPGASLTIYGSQKLHGLEDNQAQQAFLDEMEREGAFVRNPIPQGILADKMRDSWALLMPNSYPEICSNLLLQAQACGLPVITSNIGSVGEFIENEKTGIITEKYPHDLFLWIKKYAEATVKLMKDDAQHQLISQTAPGGVLSWEDIGEQWNEKLHTLV
jgi:glycosyltransferase involved in cell wall biosynthesis